MSGRWIVSNRRIDMAALSGMVARGMTDPQIAAELGVHRASVLGARKRLRLPAAYDPSSPPAAVRKRMATGGRSSGVEAARIAGVRDKSDRVGRVYGLSGIRPKAVAVLLSLLGGPLSRRRVAEAVSGFDGGFGHNRDIAEVGTVYVQRMLTALTGAGLVARAVRAGGAARRVTPDVYMLTLKAMEVLIGNRGRGQVAHADGAGGGAAGDAARAAGGGR